MTKIIYFLSCFFLNLFAYSQSAKDSLIIEDTTQVHLLKLTSVDKLLGNLMEMKETKLVFKFHDNFLKFDSVNVSQIYFLKQVKKKYKKK